MKSIGLNLISIKPLCNYRDEKVVNRSESLETLKLIDALAKIIYPRLKQLLILITRDIDGCVGTNPLRMSHFA